MLSLLKAERSDGPESCEAPGTPLRSDGFVFRLCAFGGGAEIDHPHVLRRPGPDMR